MSKIPQSHPRAFIIALQQTLVPGSTTALFLQTSSISCNACLEFPNAAASPPKAWNLDLKKACWDGVSQWHPANVIGKTRDLFISPSESPWIVSSRRRASVTSWTAVATSGTECQFASQHVKSTIRNYKRVWEERKWKKTDLLDKDH